MHFAFVYLHSPCSSQFKMLFHFLNVFVYYGIHHINAKIKVLFDFVCKRCASTFSFFVSLCFYSFIWTKLFLLLCVHIFTYKYSILSQQWADYAFSRHDIVYIHTIWAGAMFINGNTMSHNYAEWMIQRREQKHMALNKTKNLPI